jgi:ABC-type transport system involved in cytochrome c biogenesis ATPase subunit
VTNAAAAVCLSGEHPSQIDFAEVRFGYRRQKQLLHVPSLRILPGEQVAIAGENGAGKSTLAKLIARLYDPDSGSIRIGNVDIRSIQLKDLHQYISYLPRDPVLFDGTLSFNLRFVRPAAPDGEVQEAIRSVGLSQFVAALPHGLTSRQFRGINDDSLWAASKSKRYMNLVSPYVAIFKEVVLLFLSRIPVRSVFPTRSLDDDRLLLSKSIVLHLQGHHLLLQQ